MKLYLEDIQESLNKAFPLKFFIYENTFGSKKGEKFICYRGDLIELNIYLYDDHISCSVTDGAHPDYKFNISKDFYSLQMFLDHIEYYLKHFRVYDRNIVCKDT
jgi:hypothetical protein